MTWILIAMLALTPVQALMELEGIDFRQVTTTVDGYVIDAGTSSTIAQSASIPSVASVEVVVVEDDQGDLIVSHPDEPFTYTVEPGRITVTPAVHTSVLISAHPWPVPEWGDDGYGADWWEAYHDQPTTHAVLEFPLGCVKYSIVVIVNGHSQVSNLTGEVGCE